MRRMRTTCKGDALSFGVFCISEYSNSITHCVQAIGEEEAHTKSASMLNRHGIRLASAF